MSQSINFIALIDGLKDLATPDSIILNSEEQLTEIDIYRAAAIRIKKLISLDAYAFLSVNDDFEFSTTLTEPESEAEQIGFFVEGWIDSGIFSWAINQNRALVHNEGDDLTAIFHSITSAGHVAGMFVGLVNQDETITELKTSLLSVVLMNCGNSIEAYNLNAALKRHNENLEFLIQERTKELEVAKERAEKQANDKSSFLSTMSHEIRTPMNGVIGMAQILAATPLNEEQKKYVRTITDSGMSLTNLINDILDFSKIEAGKLELDYTAFSLSDLCRDVSLLFSSQLKNKNVKIELAIPKNEPHYIFADTGRLRQVLNNLVSNAVKFTQKGFITIQIVHHDTSDRRHFYIAVIDSGIGISPEDQKRLFQPFTQSGPTIAHKHGGTGLGLSICKRIVELMGGKIGVTSQYSKGATFWIEVSFERAAAELVHSNNETASVDESTKLNGTILVAEDNEINQEVIRLMLSAMGLNSIIVNNGLEALTVLEKDAVDLILMDCQMPVLDGFDTTKRIIDTYGNDKRPPIIALTANAFSSDAEKCHQVGMDDFMSKPVDQVMLHSMLSKWLPQITTALPEVEITEKNAVISIDNTAADLVDSIIIKRLIGLSPDAFVPLRDNFLNNTKKRLTELEKAHTEHDIPTIERLAHSLKGSCATFGAKKMSGYAAEIEQLAKQEQYDTITSHLSQLIDCFEPTRLCFTQLSPETDNIP